MPILVDLYSSRALTQAINKVAVTEPFVINTLFSKKEPHDSDKVDIEIVSGSGKIAKFVNANEPNPRPIKNTTKKVETVTIPRTYESKIFTAHELKDIGVIGDIYGSPEAKKAAQADKVALELVDLKERVLRVREKMACDAIATGLITVNQDNVAFGIDYGFVATEQLIELSGAAYWSATTSKPIQNLRLWKRMIMRACFYNADTLILGTGAADALLGNTDVLTMLHNNNTKVGNVDLTLDGTIAATYLGRLLGMNVYEYAQQYTDDEGSVQDMIPTNRAILIASKAPNRLHFGPAYRMDGNSVKSFNGEFLLEVNEKSNKTMLQWDCEQKSLPAIHDPGAVISVKVVA